MAGPADVQVCPGCGSRLPAVDGPTHAYMTSSPACWAAFNQVLAREYQDPALMAVHRLSVDAFAVQHPGDGSRRAIQSVGLHLARLMTQLEKPAEGALANDLMLGFAARKHELPALPAPARFEVTAADVANAPDHIDAVRRWAQSAWQAWSDQHDFIRRWAAGAPG